MGDRKTLKVVEDPKMIWQLVTKHCRYAAPLVPTSKDQDFRIDQMIRCITNNKSLRKLKDVDLTGSILSNGNGCSSDFLSMLETLESWRKRVGFGEIAIRDALISVLMCQWDIPPLEIRRLGDDIDSVSSPHFEQLTGYRIYLRMLSLS